MKMPIVWRALIGLGAFIVLVGLIILVGIVPIGSQNLQTQDKNLNDFTVIDLNNGFQAQITQGSSYSVSITADSNVIDKIDAVQTNNILTIGLQPGTLFVFGTLKAIITMPDLQEIHLSGGANANVSGFVLAHELLVSEEGGSKLQMEGQASNLSAVCTGGSSLELSSLEVNQATITMDGGSTGTTNVTGLLNADLNGGSTLTYTGNPTLGSIVTSGLSTISGEP